MLRPMFIVAILIMSLLSIQGPGSELKEPFLFGFCSDSQPEPSP